LNPIYEPYEAGVDEVLEIWKFHSFHSANLPENTGDLADLYKVMQEMKADIKSLKSKS